MTPRDAKAEIELKLLLAPRDLDALARSRRLRGLLNVSMHKVALSATYYDTAERCLRRDGLSLRTRREGRIVVQTVKANGANGRLGHRHEWEWLIGDEAVDVAPILAEPDLADRFAELPADALRPVFTTRVERRVMRLGLIDGPAPAVVELALDKGAIEADGHREDVCEAEIELKDGDPGALLALVDDLRRRVPVRLCTLDKAARGYMLAEGTPPPWRKAILPALDPNASLDAALAAVTEACLAHWLANEAAARSCREIDGLHQLRVALRRIRAALGLFKPWLGPSAPAWNDRMGDLIDRFGRARDLDVLVEQRLPSLEKGLSGDGALMALRSQAEAARRAAHEEVAATIDGRAYADTVLDFAAWISSRGWRDGGDAATLDAPLLGVAGGALQARHKRVMRRGRNFEKLGPEGRHELRLALKKLRYATDFLAGLYPGKAAKRYAKAAAKLQEVLGNGNDAAVGAELAAKLAGQANDPDALAGAAFLRGWNARDAASLEKRARKAWRAFRGQERFWQSA